MRTTFSAVALSAAVLAPLVSAHGHVSGVQVAGDWTPGADPVWFYLPANQQAKTAGWKALNQDNGFVSPDAFGGNDIACHKSATPGADYIEANPGETLTFYWNTWPESHKGPIINYLAPCNGDCTTASASSLRFTKIQQAGLITPGGTGTWVTDQLISKNFTATLTLPSKLKAGNYVLRHEIIALHGGQSDNGAQAYPQCLNLKVGGSGSVSLPSGTAGNALYKRSEPGIIFNLYTNPTSYTFPGPALWTGAN
ncbi:lytic polysaccharide monooxygenase [Aaosphaeria arxii CBS 175.79]|uniref:Lytic polysaccharide monooxygenase n=1 Tax=Aaosphaeria arxii CBS 175.79 TaxID=1450172 RepID=A0A6A5X7P9_9PLEO|nr:lytic polysaccharide monooxygenase [Aaosphaeria arxii CBS 175.79]KAF2008950.1 lytic polysaccharide monooxygenase [Aaosphaeria arxii CBS 175.79]